MLARSRSQDTVHASHPRILRPLRVSIACLSVRPFQPSVLEWVCRVAVSWRLWFLLFPGACCTNSSRCFFCVIARLELKKFKLGFRLHSDDYQFLPAEYFNRATNVVIAQCLGKKLRFWCHQQWLVRWWSQVFWTICGLASQSEEMAVTRLRGRGAGAFSAPWRCCWV